MSRTNDHRRIAFNSGSLVLMARLVDGAGVNVRQTGLSAIEYSIDALNRRRPDRFAVVAGHDSVQLDVGNVIFDALQTGDLWSVDGEGYNFRHEIEAVGQFAMTYEQGGWGNAPDSATGALPQPPTIGNSPTTEINAGEDAGFSTTGRCYQIRYEITTTAGRKTIVRFQLRMNEL